MNLDQRIAGVLLHLTSLPGPHGIGDFGLGAYHFADWLHGAGQRLWQWLPTTPIGPGDSPYQSVSAFAGSPLMVALEPLIDKGWLPSPVLPDGGFDDRRVDYGRVVPWRMAQLRAAWAGFKAHADAPDRAALAAHGEAEAHWLDDYALFMALEHAHGQQPWWTWPAPLAARRAGALREAREQLADEIGFWRWVQWCFDTQCSALIAYCHARDIHIMGDLPIFIAHHSADCWARPGHYLLDKQFQPTAVAGAPPDGMGPLGQRWGNPLYRWDKMKQDGYAWWTARMRRALQQADVFRIDHFRGFAMYWEIPAESETAQVGQWRAGPGMALFSTIAEALGPLPIVAEDLGFITADVHALRRDAGFPGMKILQFAFGGDGMHEYLPHTFEPATVVYTGTHDNDTVHGWWAGASEQERGFAGTYLACDADDVHWGMIRAALNSVANLALYPMQDVLGLDNGHRMNLPGSLGGGNWGWRFSWDMVGPEPGRVLGMMTAACGRGPFEPLGTAPPKGEPPTY